VCGRSLPLDEAAMNPSLYILITVKSPPYTITALTIHHIREHGINDLYSGMVTEILKLPWLCVTWIMAKEATNPKPSMQRE